MAAAGDIKTQLLYGRVGVSLPPLRSRVVRIFTSSTFTDTSVERNALMKDIYPKLKDYCKSKYGLEFQVVDMRWGVRDEATDDHMTSELCMNEIAACQKLSMGPNFVTFLCQKYGYRPFPPKIPAAEFEVMRQVLVRNNASVRLLDEWFQRDDNCVPPVYILQPISSRLVHFKDNDNPERMTADRNKWWEIFEALQYQLRYAATVCQQERKMTEKQAAKFRISVTHDEVTHGILDAPGNKEDHCVCFIRKFNDLNQRVDHKEAKNFIDIKWDNNQVDAEAQQLLTFLREKQLPSCLKQSNLIVSTLNNWSEKGVDVNIPEHKQYLDSFLKRFHDTMVAMIDRAFERDKNHISNEPMYEEILQHLTFCKLKCTTFHGRQDLLSEVQVYLQERANGNQNTASPMVIYGESGSGKTSVVAKAVQQTATNWFGRTDAAIVLRFLGTTPASTGIRQLLRSVCKQILTIYGYADQELPDDFFKVVRWFSQVLRYATKKKPLFIFLDSLDQLSPAEGAHRLTWLPKQLPPHAAIVISTLPKEHDLLSTMQYMLAPGMTRYTEVKRLSVQDSLNIMDSWLRTENRTITPEQRVIVTSSIEMCSLPLFLKLMFDQASSWQSYMPTSQINIEASVKGMISVIFDQLEEYHGKILVSRALGYMTISENGIAEAELEDILSLDDDVLQEVYAYWLPPTRRIPPLLWTRIRAEINDYLVEREAEGARVIYWYHRQFIEAARERYLNDDHLVKKMHKLCAEYFIGIWSGGKKKPFTYTKQQMQKFGKPQRDEEDRKVAPQPLEFGEGQQQARFNIRKLEQLPFHEIHTSDLDHLKDNTLCSLPFILTKLRGMGLGEVLQDFGMALAKYEDDGELRVLSDTLRGGASALRENPFNLIVEIIGRLKNFEGKSIKKLVAEAEKATTTTVPLIPYNQCFPAPGGLLRSHLLGHTDSVLCLASTTNGRFIVSGSRDLTAIVWDLESSTILHRLAGHHTRPITQIEITPDNILAVTYNFIAESKEDRSPEINVWNIETGDLFIKLAGHTGDGDVGMRVSSDSKFAVCTMILSIKQEDYWRPSEQKHYMKAWSLENGRELFRGVEAHKGQINDIVPARAQNGRNLIVTCGDTLDPAIKIWDMFTCQLLREVLDRRKRQNHPTLDLEVSSNGQYVAFQFYRHAILDVHTCVIIDLTDEETRGSCLISFLTDKEVLFKNESESPVIYNIEERKLVRTLKINRSHEVDLFAITDDCKTMVSIGENSEKALLWQVKENGNFESATLDFKIVADLPHNAKVNAITVVNVNPTVFAATASLDNSVKIWNIANVKQALKQEAENKRQTSRGSKNEEAKKPFNIRCPNLRLLVHRARILEDEKRIAIVNSLGTSLSLYDVEEGTLIASVDWVSKRGSIGGIDTTPDGKRLYALGENVLMEYDTNSLQQQYEKPKTLDVYGHGIRVSENGSTSAISEGMTPAGSILNAYTSMMSTTSGIWASMTIHRYRTLSSSSVANGCFS
ncbi:NACHT and WD repeat domain-containing protein 2-like [Ptychodera flava]|uniref:NACHT and WD repeat domain-containing protein 2-like n=1 Tax=Ptychodera flava TaxID=63121 RepID=UPI00396AA518